MKLLLLLALFLSSCADFNKLTPEQQKFLLESGGRIVDRAIDRALPVKPQK